MDHRQADTDGKTNATQIPQCSSPISHNTPWHFVTEMCTYMLIVIIKWYIVRYKCLMHCGICKMGQLFRMSNLELIILISGRTHICMYVM